MKNETFEEWHSRYFNMEVFDGEYINDDVEATYSFQQAKIDELQEEIRKLRSGEKGACHCCEPVGELNKELQAKLDKAIECIKFYAEVDCDLSINYPKTSDYEFDILTDKKKFYRSGKRARACLKELGEDHGQI